ncbi:MAG: PQQ-dependent sugar dehydrogenase [Cypionkella sp.]
MKTFGVVLTATLLGLTSVLLWSCGSAPDPVATGFGPNPRLPAPERRLLPTVNVAKAEAWAEGQAPRPADGLRVTEFARDLDHPRWLYELPNGDVLVAESNAPPQPEEGSSIKGFFTKRIMAKAGAAVPSADRISLLRDADSDGVAELHVPFMTGLHSPFGMALVGATLYIANADGIVSVPYRSAETRITDTPRPFFALPGGPRNHHWTKNIVASPDGKTLYATVGSNSNVAENGMSEETGRAAIWKIDIASVRGEAFATGLRNPVGMDFDRGSGKLYTVVNERDELGDNLVPDYLTSVKDGGFYGWPYSYFGQNVDDRVSPQRPDLVARAIAPDYALGAHTASLGLDITDRTEKGIAAIYGYGAFIGQHGSWNRKPRSGYQVIFVPFVGGRPAGPPATVLDGFLVGDTARGRPVGVILDRRGGLLVADDVGNRVWRVSPK